MPSTRRFTSAPPTCRLKPWNSGGASLDEAAPLRASMSSDSVVVLQLPDRHGLVERRRSRGGVPPRGARAPTIVFLNLAELLSIVGPADRAQSRPQRIGKEFDKWTKS